MCLWLAAFMSACEPEHNDDVRTVARVSLSAPDSVALLQANGTISMQCLSNKLTWTSDEWDSISVNFPEVMRGENQRRQAQSLSFPSRKQLC